MSLRSLWAYPLERYAVFDRWLAQNHPRLWVLRLPEVFSFGLIASLVAAIHGRLTPGTPGDLSDVDGGTTAWFLMCSVAMMCWAVSQWRHRSTLPRGCRAGFVWCMLTNLTVLIPLFVPPFLYHLQNNAAIRETVPLRPIMVVIEEAYTRIKAAHDTRNVRGSKNWLSERLPVELVYFDSFGQLNYCEASFAECLASGSKMMAGDASVLVTSRELCRGGMSVSSYEGVAALYDESLLKEYCARPARGADLSEAGKYKTVRDRFDKNIMRALRAYGMTLRGNVLRDQAVVVGYFVFFCLIASIVSLFSVISLRFIWGAVGCWLGVVVFIMVFQEAIHLEVGADSYVMRVLMVAPLLMAMLCGLLMRRRGIVGDLVIVVGGLSSPFVAATWMLLRWNGPVSEIFFLGDSFRFWYGEATRWIAEALLLSLLLSPITMSLSDRYRKLPAA